MNVEEQLVTCFKALPICFVARTERIFEKKKQDIRNIIALNGSATEVKP
jgi:hypothetical protein